MPPMLLVGPPGVGKTYFARKLGSAIGTTVLEQSMTGADDTILTGHSVSWKGARIGVVARTLIEGETASPLIFVDEIDKPQNVGHADLLDPFHSLLEPENARVFVDTYLEVPLRADKILWVATANETSHLKPSLLDRFVVLRIEPPNHDERCAIINNLYGITVRAYGSFFDSELSIDVIDALADDPPRRMRMVIELAMGFAIADRRPCLSTEDVHAARRLAASSVTRQRIGFHTTSL